ncbi:unnamed protein product [Spodoptera littoralis]|uniref:Chitin-binding type-2 domain-containing protein n=1 Tax=Spodoptera littoralis TaxID=7109 RepID=A0A9P0IBV6_SPOLI|nr:unnamed protein product [Spodoptera littoralis]CAH1643061.1 unnamed protein product [Spodoptera littoralis]
MPTVTPLPPCTTTDAWLRPQEPFCNRFLLCLFGQLISEVCSPGYHFSPTQYQCMPVADAQCEDAFTTTTMAITTTETTPATKSDTTIPITTSESTPVTTSESTPATSSETTDVTTSKSRRDEDEITSTTSETTPAVTTSETTPSVTSSETTPPVTSSETTPSVTTSETTPATSSETTPSVTTSETAPITSSETTPATSSETTPSVTTSETTPSVTTSETTPITSSETTPATSSDTTPAVTTSETTPITSSETTPAFTTSETTPTVTSSDTTITTTKRSTPLCTNRDLWLKPQYSYCDRFLLCLFGKITSQRCPLDFQFNPVLLLCQPPAEANCNSETTTITPTTKQDPSPDNRIRPPPSTTIETTLTTIVDTTVTSPETTPVTSSETTPVTSSETTTVTTLETTTVTTSETATATSPETTSITTSETIPAPLPKCSYRDMWFKPDPHNCEYFYLCVFGEILHEQCPEGTEASITSFACLPKELAGCSNANQTIVTTTPRVIRPVPYCSRYDMWIEADATDCGQYYVCTFGHLTHETCPAEYRFSALEKECLPKSQVNCFEKDQSTPRNWKDAICADYSNLPLVFLEDPKDCRRYYICSLGKSTLLHCPDNFSFSVEKQICLPSYQVLCKSLCPSDATQFVVDPQSESRYIICYNGTPLPQQCPHKYVFDPKLLTCRLKKGIRGVDSELLKYLLSFIKS